jgi:hypothetical protein
MRPSEFAIALDDVLKEIRATCLGTASRTPPPHCADELDTCYRISYTVIWGAEMKISRIGQLRRRAVVSSERSMFAINIAILVCRGRNIENEI